MTIWWTTSRICTASTPSSLASSMSTSFMTETPAIYWTKPNGLIKFASLEHFLTGTTNGGTILVGDATTNFRSHWFAGFFQDDWRITHQSHLEPGPALRIYGVSGGTQQLHGQLQSQCQPGYHFSDTTGRPGRTDPFPIQFQIQCLSRQLFRRAWAWRGTSRAMGRPWSAPESASCRTTQACSTLVGAAPFGANIFRCTVLLPCPTLSRIANTSGTAVNAHTPDMLTRICRSAECGLEHGGTQYSPLATASMINGVTYTGLTCTPHGYRQRRSQFRRPCAVVDPNFRQPHAAEWNLDIERAITNNLAIDVAYVGNYGFDEPFSS